jgi:hypothetical protein
MSYQEQRNTRNYRCAGGGRARNESRRDASLDRRSGRFLRGDQRDHPHRLLPEGFLSEPVADT